MKKFLGFLLLVGCMAGVSWGYDYQMIPDQNALIHHQVTLANTVTSTSNIIVDLSDTTNWPHDGDKEIRISGIRVDIDKAAASTCTVKLGVITYVASSTGSVKWFHVCGSTINVSNTATQYYVNYAPSYLRTLVVQTSTVTEGSTPHFMSNDETLKSTTYQTDVLLPTTYGTDAYPKVGDIILYVFKPGIATTANIFVDLIYNGRKQ